MKKSKFLYFITFFAGLIGCKTNTALKIEPIDKEFNEKLLVGNKLNDNLFSEREKLQYYQVDDFKGLKPVELQSKLDSYVVEHYSLSQSIDFETLTIFFYKKENLVNYSDLIYEAAQDPIGAIEGHNSNLLAKIIFTKHKQEGTLTHKRLVYDKGEVILTKSDTLSLK